MSHHTQCRLRKGDIETVGWIESHLAVVGKPVRMKLDDGTWETGWNVIEVWTTAPSEVVKERERDYLRQREASDI